ncbi:hypothetical protein DERP_010940, partial [Dermatophagoides pteronyssinus]
MTRARRNVYTTYLQLGFAESSCCDWSPGLLLLTAPLLLSSVADGLFVGVRCPMDDEHIEP